MGATCSYLVAADGAGSPVRRQLGIHMDVRAPLPAAACSEHCTVRSTVPSCAYTCASQLQGAPGVLVC